MRDKKIGCICTADDPYECFRERYPTHRGILDEDEEKEECSCGCHTENEIRHSSRERFVLNNTLRIDQAIDDIEHGR
jgi:hypothetical protein